MNTFDFDWQTQDHLTLEGKAYLPDNAPKAMICTVHGFAEHFGRYVHVAAHITSQGYGLIGFDLRGHGRSGGKRAHAPNMEALLEDVRAFVALVNEKFPHVPLFLYGHSMGGNIVANFILRNKPTYLQGVIITSPWLKLAFTPPAIKLWLANLMSKIYPKFTEKNELNAKELSHDDEVGKAYNEDPLVLHTITARLFSEITQAGLYALVNASKFSLPLLLMHGTGDNITSHKASQEFASKVPNHLITTEWWADMRHELHNEIVKEQVVGKMCEWIKERLVIL
jgi:acylglycerol lipase